MNKQAPYLIIFIVLCIWSTASTIKTLYKVVRGMALIERTKANHGTMVQGTNTFYKVWAYFIGIALDVATIYVLYRFLLILKSSGFLHTIVMIDIILMGLILMVHVIAIFEERYVYLTDIGLIYFMGCFEFSKCRFSWEESEDPEKLSDTLHVYRKKEKTPFTATFDLRLDLAHHITERNSGH